MKGGEEEKEEEGRGEAKGKEGRRVVVTKMPCRVEDELGRPSFPGAAINHLSFPSSLSFPFVFLHSSHPSPP